MILMTLPGGRCHAQPGSDKFVAVRFHDVLLVDQGGKVIRTIRRKPNGNWLDTFMQVALGTDGSIAILSDLSVDLYDFAIFIISQGIIVSGNAKSPRRAKAADHVLLAKHGFTINSIPATVCSRLSMSLTLMLDKTCA